MDTDRPSVDGKARVLDSTPRDKKRLPETISGSMTQALRIASKRPKGDNCILDFQAQRQSSTISRPQNTWSPRRRMRSILTLPLPCMRRIKFIGKFTRASTMHKRCSGFSSKRTFTTGNSSENLILSPANTLQPPPAPRSPPPPAPHAILD